MKVCFEALAALTMKNKNAGAVMLMMIPRMGEGEGCVYVSPSDVAKCTGMSKGTVSLALRFLVENSYITKDVYSDCYYISNRLVYTPSTSDTDYTFSGRIKWFPSLSAPKVSKRQLLEIETMNSLSEEDIANANF